jgi:hypothetical protein
MRKRGSNKEAEVDALINALSAWKFKTEGLSFPEIAARMDVSLKTVRRYIDRILPAASSFPTELTAEEVNKGRQMLSDLLLSAMAMVRRHMAAVDEDGKIAANDKLQASAAGLKSLSMASARLAAMNAYNAPVETREESIRLMQVNVNRTGGKPILTWDRSILTEPVRRVEGLTIYEGCRNNGDTEKQLPDTPAN